jgi:hypothetical protein
MDLAQAHQLTATGHIRGKIVLKVAPERKIISLTESKIV